MAEQTNAQLEARIALLEKIIKEHLGPKYAQTSLNNPHPELANNTATVNLINTAGRYL